jgi:hypothetical protein
MMIYIERIVPAEDWKHSAASGFKLFNEFILRSVHST